jgi:PAS domain S-box-containing protein
MKNVTPPNVLIGFSITLVLMVINVFTAYQNITKIDENDRMEAYHNDVVSFLAMISLEIKDAEMRQREYWLTNHPYYLQANRFTIGQIQGQLKLLQNLTDYQQQPEQSQLVQFSQKIEDRLGLLVQNIDRRQVRPLLPDRQLELSKQGQYTIEQIQQLIANFDRTERQTLDLYKIKSRENLVFARLSFSISGLLDLLLLVILYRLVNLDLTKRQQAESVLRDYVTEFEELYHNAPCGYHSLDRTGKFIRINRTELQMLGYAETELVWQKRLPDLLTPESVQKFDEAFPLVKSRGWIRDLELQLVRKDGQIIPVSATVVAIKDADGNYLTSRSTLIDISERIRLRQQAKLSAEISQKIRQSLQLEEILQTTVKEVQTMLGVDRVLLFRFEADGSGTIVKEKVLAGYPPVMGQEITDPCFDLSYHDRYHQGQIDSVADLTQSGLTPCYVEFLQQFAVQASVTAPILLRDKLWGLLIIHHCRATRVWLSSEVALISQLANQIGIALSQAQLLEQERQQRQELARSNAELEQFAYVASHDLQEPLRMVTSYIQLLERRYKGKLDDNADEFISYAVDGATRMQTLIQALLSYARVSSRGQPFATVNCNLVLQDVLANLQVAVSESAAIITSDPLPEVTGDRTQLTQLFQNLIANALKFCRDTPPAIHLSVLPVDPSNAHQSSTTDLASAPSAWQFALTDNGIGIEPQYLDRIFVIFQRLHSRSTYSGTGIGLAICKKIVERHGGQIWVESQPGRGSTFYFIIPGIGSTSP